MAIMQYRETRWPCDKVDTRAVHVLSQLLLGSPSLVGTGARSSFSLHTRLARPAHPWLTHLRGWTEKLVWSHIHDHLTLDLYRSHRLVITEEKRTLKQFTV
jgi:hypothetical protein